MASLVLLPAHGRPFLGGGLSQRLSENCFPPPQETEQADQDFQPDQAPSTGRNDKSRKIEVPRGSHAPRWSGVGGPGDHKGINGALSKVVGELLQKLKIEVFNDVQAKLN